MRWIGCVLLAACGGSQVSALVKQGKYAEACNATDATYSRELVDAIVQRSDITVSFTPWQPADALAAAKVTTPPTDDHWMALAVEIDFKSGPITEMSITTPDLRADGWSARGAMGTGDSYKLLTGKTLAPRGTAMTGADIAAGVKGVITNDPNDKARFGNAITPDQTPDDLGPAEAFASLFGTSCGVTPGAHCRSARFYAPAEIHTAKPAAIAFTVRYAMADSAGAHCTQVEHVVIPLAEGPDLSHRLAATFTAPRRLFELRARARVHAANAEDPFFED